MKAAIVQKIGEPPVYGDFKDVIVGEDEVRVAVTAAPLTHLTKGRAAGTHYSSAASVPFVPGVDGVGVLNDSRRVYFIMPTAPFGSMAQFSAVPLSQCIRLPDDLDDVTAAAVVNPGMSSWAAFRDVAMLVSGETVLVNGATGSAGRLAVQIAKHLGAKRVIATGRNEKALAELTALGADAIIVLVEDADVLEDMFKEQLADGVDVVVDYIWGVSAERLLSARTKVGKASVPLRFVQIGNVSSPNITLPGSVLRSTAIKLMGSGLGSIPNGRLIDAARELLNSTVSAGFKIVTNTVPLSDVEKAWSTDSSQSRTVFTLGLEHG